jgi:uncharacterized membrane protein
MTVLAGLVAAYALANALVPAVRGGFVVDLFDQKAARAFGHMAFGGISLLAGALQFSTRLRFGRPAVHRLLGRVYALTVLVSGVSALLLAPSSTGGLSAHFGFGFLAALWLTTTARAVLDARRGAFDEHRAWMIRSYALCLAAVTLRLQLAVGGVAGVPFEASYPAIAWLCWVPNLIIAEWLVIGSAVAPLEPRPTR